MNARHLGSSKASAIVKMSLSPRPLWLITIASFFDRVGASLNAWTNACADSSAGIRPSFRTVSESASTTSSSVAASKPSRPEAARSERIGETPT